MHFIRWVYLIHGDYCAGSVIIDIFEKVYVIKLMSQSESQMYSKWKHKYVCMSLCQFQLPNLFLVPRKLAIVWTKGYLE